MTSTKMLPMLALAGAVAISSGVSKRTKHKCSKKKASKKTLRKISNLSKKRNR